MTQHMIALAKANAVRLERARVKREIRGPANRFESGRILADHLEQRHFALQTAAVSEALEMRHQAGPAATRTFLRRAGLHLRENRRVGDLTDRELDIIVTTLRLPVKEERAAA